MKPIDYSAAINQLEAKLQDDVFNTSVAARLLGVSRAIAAAALRQAVTLKRVKILLTPCTFGRYISGAHPCHVFSFDFTKDENDALDAFDPIPVDKRSLDIQLIGDERKRYLELLTRKRAQIPLELYNATL